MYTHTSACIHIYAYIHTDTHTYIYIHMRMHIYTHTCTHIFICMYMHTYIQIKKSQQRRLNASSNVIDAHTYPYTSSCTYIYIYSHTHMCTPCSECVADVYVDVKQTSV